MAVRLERNAHSPERSSGQNGADHGNLRQSAASAEEDEEDRKQESDAHRVDEVPDWRVELERVDPANHQELVDDCVR
jgi:hypothetical protein